MLGELFCCHLINYVYINWEKLLVHLSICMSIVARDKQDICRIAGHTSFWPLKLPPPSIEKGWCKKDILKSLKDAGKFSHPSVCLLVPINSCIKDIKYGRLLSIFYQCFGNIMKYFFPKSFEWMFKIWAIIPMTLNWVDYKVV